MLQQHSASLNVFHWSVRECSESQTLQVGGGAGALQAGCLLTSGPSSSTRVLCGQGARRSHTVGWLCLGPGAVVVTLA